MARVARVTLLGVADMIALTGAVLLAYVLWALPAQSQPFALYAELAPLAVLFIVGYALAGLYPGLGLGPVETLRRHSSRLPENRR